MNEFLMIPKKELPRDVDYYKGELTGNAWLNEAAQLAAAKKRILQDKSLPDEEAVRRIKPLGHQITRANKKLRQISVPGGGDGNEEDDDDDEEEEGTNLASTSMEKWLRRIAKTLPKTPKSTPRSTLQTIGEPSTSRVTPQNRERIKKKAKALRKKLNLPGDDVQEHPQEAIERHRAFQKQFLGDYDQSSTPRSRKDPTLLESMTEGAISNLLGKGKRPKKPPKKYTPSQSGKGLAINRKRHRPLHWIPFH